MKGALVLLLLLALPTSVWGATREKLPNGLQVIVQPDPATEVVAATLLLRVSAADEPADKAGVRYVTHQLLLRGTNRESGEAMGNRLAEVGGDIGVTVGLDYVEIHVVSPSEGFETTLNLLAEVVRDPAFLPEEFARARQRAQEALQTEREEAFSAAYGALREEIYGDSPYGRSTLGKASTLQRLTREEVVSFYRQHYAPTNTLLALAGGIELNRARRAIKQAFGDWRAGSAEPVKASEMQPLQHSNLVVREAPVKQAYLVLGSPAPAVGEGRYFTLQVMDSLLSGGSGARLPQALRGEVGLAYQIASFYPTLAGGSHFGIYAATDPEQIAVVKGIIVRELTRLREEPVSAEELTRAKRYLLGSYAMSRQEAQSQAYSLAWYALLGLEADFAPYYRQSVEKVTAQQVQETAQELIRYFVLAITLPRQ